MIVRRFLIDFALVFSVTFVVAAIVTYLWNLIAHGQSVVDWETSFRLAIILGIALPVTRIPLFKRK